MTSGLGEACKNPFLGQDILLQDSPTFPKFLVPARFRQIKELAGYNIAYLNYFAKYYNFKWKPEFVGGGRFHYQNNTFGPGRFNGVIHICSWH